MDHNAAAFTFFIQHLIHENDEVLLNQFRISLDQSEEANKFNKDLMFG